MGKDRMSHINVNHLYYFWPVCKTSSVAGDAERFSPLFGHKKTGLSRFF
ncbi:hypothetical protein DDI_3617 [Dickeya dianthicola RNS04.9]|nr:hypothetical protein DDI_3617 [Dickeya dianthicola RNS04.9]